MPKLTRVRTEISPADVSNPKSRVWRTSSLLEQEYPEEYKDLFFDPSKNNIS
jgi:hypothetical protein